MVVWYVVCMSAMKAITKQRLNSATPNLDDWYNLIYSIFVMEQMIFHKRLQIDKFDKIWEKLRTCLN